MPDSDFRLRQIFLSAFGPSILFGIAQGAIFPVIALTSLQLHPSHAVSGTIVALIGLGSLINNIPAAMLTSRVGERRAMIGTAMFSALGVMLCLYAPHVAILALGVFMQGMSQSVFYLARQSFLIDAVPLHLRARAFSTLGGCQRLGLFVGPFMAAAAMEVGGIAGAYWIAVVALIATALLCLAIPELEATKKQPTTHQKHESGEQAKIRPTPQPQSMWTVAKHYRHTLLTIGIGVMLIGALRASRPIVLPLWSEHIGLSPSMTAVVFGIVSAIDVLMFYPAGKVMDEYGRLWVALPCTLLLGLSFMLIPLASHLPAFIAVALVMGFGNGIGSGIMMTLGADAAPKNGRIAFLGLWRLLSDVGTSSGPFILAGVTAMVSLGAGIATIGVSGPLAAAIFWRFIPPHKPAPTAKTDT